MITGKLLLKSASSQTAIRGALERGASEESSAARPGPYTPGGRRAAKSPSTRITRRRD